MKVTEIVSDVSNIPHNRIQYTKTSQPIIPGQKVIGDIQRTVPRANVELMLLDLNSLDSVRDFASKLHSIVDKVNLILNRKISTEATKKSCMKFFAIACLCNTGPNYSVYFLCLSLFLLVYCSLF